MQPASPASPAAPDVVAVFDEPTSSLQKRDTIHVWGQTEAGFIAMRGARDKTLPLPKLMLQALQVNIRGGRLPEPEPSGIRYLKIPLNAFPP